MTASRSEYSFSRRLSLSLGLLSTFIIVVAASACLFYVSSLLESHLSERTTRATSFLVEALKAPMWSMDKVGASSVARGVLVDSGVGLLKIWDAQGDLWVSHETDKPRFEVLEMPIRHEGRIIGTVRFGLEDSLHAKAVRTIIVLGTGIAVLVVLTQFLLMSSLVHALFRKPLKAIDAMVGGLARGDATPDAQEAMRCTEFKALTRSFLEMDATIRRQFQDLRESANKYRAIFNHSPVGIFRSSHSGRLVEANPAFARMFGYGTVAELAEVSLGSVERLYAPSGNRKLLLDALEACSEGATLEVELRRRDDSVFLGAIIASVEYDAAMRPAFINGIIEDITERKRTEKALAESEAKFRDLFETMPNGFYRSSPEGYFVDANPAFVRMLGYDSLDDLRSVHIPTKIYVQESERQEILADNPEFVSQIENYRLRRKDGRIIRIEDNARYIQDESGRTIYHEGLCRDVTARWEAQEKLRQSEEKFARLFRLSPDAVMLVRLADGLILDVNESFAGVTGYELQEALGRTIPELGLAGDRVARRSLLEVLGQSGRAENLEFSLRKKDASVIDCVLSCQALRIDSQECVLAVLRDVTEFKRMQEMMIQTEKMISVGGIAAGVAHEINNPLGIIMSTAQNLAMRTRSDFPKNLQVAREIGLNMELMDRYMQARGLHEFIRTIQDAAMRAADIIRHMLDFSRRSESRCSACDLPAIVDKAVNMACSDFDLRREYDFKQIAIVKDYDDALPLAHCTETEIEQVFLNLLRNAAQAMSGIRHDLPDPRITVRIRNDRTHLRIEVEDNGPGMPPEVQRRVFEPFFTTKPPGVGTGLGLSVSYFIVTRSHKGRMRVESAPGEGTRFIVELPVTGGVRGSGAEECLDG